MKKEPIETKITDSDPEEYVSVDERAELLLAQQNTKITMLSAPQLLSQLLIMLLALSLPREDDSINYLRLFCYFLLLIVVSAILKKVYPHSFRREQREALALDIYKRDLTYEEKEEAMDDLKTARTRENFAAFGLLALIVGLGINPKNGIDTRILFQITPIFSLTYGYLNTKVPSTKPEMIKEKLDQITSDSFVTGSWEAKAESDKFLRFLKIISYLSGMSHAIQIVSPLFCFTCTNNQYKNSRSKVSPPDALITLFIGSWFEKHIPSTKVLVADEKTIILSLEDNDIFDKLDIKKLKKDFNVELDQLKNKWTTHNTLKNILDGNFRKLKNYHSKIKIDPQVQVQISYELDSTEQDPLENSQEIESYLSVSTKTITEGENRVIQKTLTLKAKDPKFNNIENILNTISKTPVPETQKQNLPKTSIILPQTTSNSDKKTYEKKQKKRAWFFPTPPKKDRESPSRFSPYLLINHGNKTQLENYENTAAGAQRDWVLLYRPNQKIPFAVGIFRIPQDQFEDGSSDTSYSTFHDIFLQKNVVQNNNSKPGIRYTTKSSANGECQLVISNSSGLLVYGSVVTNTPLIQYVHDAGGEKKFKTLQIIDFSRLVHKSSKWPFSYRGSRKWNNPEPFQLETYFQALRPGLELK